MINSLDEASSVDVRLLNTLLIPFAEENRPVMGRSEVNQQNVPVFVMTGLVNVLDADETRAIEVPHLNRKIPFKHVL